MFGLPYLRGTVNLLPFLLPLLGSFLLGWCSLEAQREHQEEDGDFLHAHSGARVEPAGVKKDTSCFNGEQETTRVNSTTSTTHLKNCNILQRAAKVFCFFFPQRDYLSVY